MKKLTDTLGYFFYCYPVTTILVALTFDLLLIGGGAYLLHSLCYTHLFFSSEVDQIKNSVWACLYDPNEDHMICQPFMQVALKLFGNGILGHTL